MTEREFLIEMSREIPYEQREVKGMQARSEMAALLLRATFALPVIEDDDSTT
jgi:hypothetical protein